MQGSRSPGTFERVNFEERIVSGKVSLLHSSFTTALRKFSNSVSQDEEPTALSFPLPCSPLAI